MKELLLVINEDSFFLSHRTRIAQAAAVDGWNVILVAKDTGRRQEIEDMGFRFIPLPINPTGMRFADEIRTFRFLYQLYRRHPDAIIHHVGLKNMLWGGIASRLTKTRGVVYAVSGLGVLFGENGTGMVAGIIQKFLRFAISKRNVAVIFQNHDDENLFLRNRVVTSEKIYFTKGSGVDLKEYGFVEHSDDEPLKIIFTARMLKEKGVIDLVKAAELLRFRYEGKIEFWLCGGLSGNPSALGKDEILDMTDGSYIKWLGHREDIPELLRQSSIMCYPSYYREGVPKSLIEASAMGLPIVTTDSVGCRDTVEDGVNGYIVPPHNCGALADALSKLIDNPEMRKSMGTASRKKAELDYDVDKVADLHLKIYGRLLSGK